VSAAVPPTATRVGWELHGIRADIRTSNVELMAYVRAHLGPAALAPQPSPDLLVDLDWRWGTGAATAEDGAASAATGERVGRHLMESDGRLHWSRVPGFEGLSMAAGSGGSTVEVAASCRYAPRDALARLRYLKAGRREKKTYRTFFKLLYYALYFPVAWFAERSRGWEILHASAVEKDGRGLVLAGHGGAGKSTLALSLMADPSFRFISDNLIFHDGKRIYSLPEPVRLDASSLGAIRAEGFEPQPAGLPRTAHPKPTFRVEPGRVAPSAEAAALVVLRFTDHSFLRSLKVSEAAAHLVGARDLVREVEDYRSVAAWLGMATAGSGAAPAPLRATAEGLAGAARGYLMGIGRDESVPETLSRLKEIFP
jgi:hypothetical protein